MANTRPNFLPLLLSISLLAGCSNSDREAIPAEQVAWLTNQCSEWGVTVKVEGAEQELEFTGSGSQWYRLKVAPEQVQTLKSYLVDLYLDRQASPPRKLGTESIADCIKESREGANQPEFWIPETLPDADAVKVGGYPSRVFIFSRTTGTVYIFLQGH